MPPAFDWAASAMSRWLTPLVLLWLAYVFGRTLRPGAMPLIERIARHSTPALSSALARYTRGLTWVWCVYFVLAAVLLVGANASGMRAGLLVWVGTAVLFAGERAIRPLLYPGESFPRLVHQLRDTWAVLRQRG
jgi:uncharacterized membrane protein